jgi:type I restriction enzyme, S subunit
MKWQAVTFEDAFEIQLGKMLDKQKNVGELRPYLGNRDVQWGKCNTSNLAEMRLSESDRERFLLQPGDLLVCEGGEVGRTAIWNGERDDCYYQKAIHRLRPKRSIEPRFVLHYMRWAADRNLFARLTSSTSIAHLTKEKLQQAQIPLPYNNGKLDLGEQRRIAAILDKADSIRGKLQQSLRLSDDFLRTVFLDMFGDPKTNSKGWPEEPMSELMSDSKIGLVRASDQFGWDMPVPYVRMDALTNDGAFLPEKVQGTTATAAEISSYSLKPGDLLFNTRNSKELVGKVAIYPGPEGATFNNNLMRIRFRKGIDPYVICAQFQFPRVQRELEARKQGTTSVFAVYGKNLATLPFLVPPFELQRDYRKVVDKVSVARQKMKALLALSESAFSSLQQRAFRGEL